MIDVVTISAAVTASLASVKSAIDLFKVFKTDSKDAQAVQSALLQSRDDLLTLKEQILTLRDDLLTVQEENHNLRAEIAAKTTDAPELRGEFYYFDSFDGPYCTGCFDTDGKRIRLVKSSLAESFKSGHLVKCPKCKTGFGTEPPM